MTFIRSDRTTLAVAAEAVAEVCQNALSVPARESQWVSLRAVEPRQFPGLALLALPVWTVWLRLRENTANGR